MKHCLRTQLSNPSVGCCSELLKGTGDFSSLCETELLYTAQLQNTCLETIHMCRILTRFQSGVGFDFSSSMD